MIISVCAEYNFSFQTERISFCTGQIVQELHNKNQFILHFEFLEERGKVGIIVQSEKERQVTLVQWHFDWV